MNGNTSILLWQLFHTLYKKQSSHTCDCFQRETNTLETNRTQRSRYKEREGSSVKRGWRRGMRDKRERRKVSLSVFLHVKSVPLPSGMLCWQFDAFETTSSILHRLYHDL